MAGHSKWAQIKRKKAANDLKRGKIISKHLRAIQAAARAGGSPYPEANVQLRNAIEAARADDVPMENIERLLAKLQGGGEGAEQYEEIVYEGYAPGGVAVLVYALTDNRNRTAGEVRHVFGKYGGSLGTSGSVAWQFEKRGVIVSENTEAAQEAAIELGALDLEEEGESLTIYTEPGEVFRIAEALKARGIRVEDAEVIQRPQNVVALPPEEAAKVLRLVEALEDLDDVQNVYTNLDPESLQVGLLLRRKRESLGRSVVPDPAWMEKFFRNLPFSLTPSQKRAIEKIEEDLRAPYPMLRLLQGDVGSGKTVVAAAACTMVASAGAQAAVMAPTEILAEQHFHVFRELLRPLPVEVGLLSGGLSRREREELLFRIAEGKVQVVVGTHALIEEDVEFRDLALAVIDEQHRFGVIQRAALEKKGKGTNILVMSATPIPRTVVLTVYGEFELSVLEELPIPKRNVRTLWLSESKREEVYEEVGRLLSQGEKGYVVFPLVEESEELDLRAATVAYEELRARFGEIVGLIHGRMPSEEKRAVMAAFREGRIRLLVATVVVELGLDVPDASFLVIEHADRFGLAQLHQLRGRIGRQGQEAVCFALADPTTEEGRERLRAFRDLSDGFKIAEADLMIRGPGDLLGTAQHGFVSKFKAADLVRDLGLLERARFEAKKLLEKGVPPEIAAEAERRFGKDLELLGV